MCICTLPLLLSSLLVAKHLFNLTVLPSPFLAGYLIGLVGGSGGHCTLWAGVDKAQVRTFQGRPPARCPLPACGCAIHFSAAGITPSTPPLQIGV